MKSNQQKNHSLIRGEKLRQLIVEYGGGSRVSQRGRSH